MLRKNKTKRIVGFVVDCGKNEYSMLFDNFLFYNSFIK